MPQPPARAKAYHVGLLDPALEWGVGNDKEVGHTLKVCLRRDIDFMPTDLWRYHGVWTTTKKAVREKKNIVLRELNAQYGTSFKRIVID
jgi:hypothetical protein